MVIVRKALTPPYDGHSSEHTAFRPVSFPYPIGTSTVRLRGGTFHIPMKPTTTFGLLYLALLGGVQTATAATGDVAAIASLPDWMIYVGLAVICPEDLNRAIRTQLGSRRPTDSDDGNDDGE